MSGTNAGMAPSDVESLADYLLETSSEESLDRELLDQSLSMWRGFTGFGNTSEDFVPIPLDLHTASSIGQYDCVKAIIDKGEQDLNKKNHGGWTALMYASYIGHDNIISLLLDANVPVNCANDKGLTPLMLAASCGNENVAYLLVQQGCDLEARDKKGWTALFHATYCGHQNMVRFLIDNGANMNAAEPQRQLTPFMEAAAAGHEIIVQYFLQHGVNVNAKYSTGDTARSLALINGHTKIVSLIDNHVTRPICPVISTDSGSAGRRDSNSSDDASVPQGCLKSASGRRTKARCLSIRDGPEAFDSFMESRQAKIQEANQSRVREATSPPGVTSHPPDGSNDPKSVKVHSTTSKPGGDTSSNPPLTTGDVNISTIQATGSQFSAAPRLDPGAPQRGPGGPRAARPRNMAELLEELDLTKYLSVFEEQDVDLSVFLTLSDADLQQIGIKLFGPRRKMTNAIARWHSNARLSASNAEQAYAYKLEGDMQDLEVKLHQALEQTELVKLQLMQEHELRKVTESCLMEYRETWAQVINLSADNLSKCTNMRELLNIISYCGEELGRRHAGASLGASVGPAPTTTPAPGEDSNSMAAALIEGLSLGGVGGRGLTSSGRGELKSVDLSGYSISQLVSRLLTSRDELVRLLTLIFYNTESLIKRNYNTGMPAAPR